MNFTWVLLLNDVQTSLSVFFKDYGSNLLKITIVYAIGRVLIELVLKNISRLYITKEEKQGKQSGRRATTLAGLMNTLAYIFLDIVILISVLRTFGVNLVPILAGAGVFGLALSFGTQNLIKDLIAGLFILIENQYSLGDRVKIGEYTGRVLKITMRSTILKDIDGQIIYIPNGTITQIINLSQASTPEIKDMQHEAEKESIENKNSKEK
jgi:small conductance mechanosensitive channel